MEPASAPSLDSLDSPDSLAEVFDDLLEDSFADSSDWSSADEPP